MFYLRVRSWQNSHASHIIQELRCPRLLLVRWLSPYQHYQLPKCTKKNTSKIANKFMTVASGEIFTKYELIFRHAAKMKDGRSVNFMANVIFPSNPTL